MKKSFCKVVSFLIVCCFLFVTFSMVAFAVEEVGIKHIYMNQISGSYSSSVSGESIQTNREDAAILNTSDGAQGYGLNYTSLSINNVTSTSFNAYFPGKQIIVDHYYKISFYTFMPYDKAVQIVSGDYNANTYTLKVGWWHAYLIDSAGNIRLNKQHYDSNVVWHNQLQPPVSDDYGLEIRTAYDGVGNAKFLFFPFEFIFCASSNYTLYHLNFAFYSLPEFVFGNARGFFGVSDFYIEDITDVPIKVTNSLDDINSNLETINSTLNGIPSRISQILRNELLVLFNNQKGFLKDYLDSIKETNDKFTSEDYSGYDDSKVNEESELTADIEDSTLAGRDQAVAIMDSASEIQGSSIENGLLMWSNMISAIFERLPWFDTMVNFALALGLFSFLMGIITYAVGKTSAKNRQQQNKSNNKSGKKGG